ncbi:MAG: TrkA family potassium uptake protein [Acidimicrobiaceae bacterium]|nr:TrkA family potassium uptake protein [Ilumatobacteraceae bacterium]NQW68219.1 TrkA family potassium uptake protein [Acidimicrobiaceae bacterium]
MHVVIVGCGRVGSTLARELSLLGNTVAVIDRRADAFLRLGDDFAGQTLVGIGFDPDILISAGIERADALAAVTNGDNSNIMIARVARERFGIHSVVARIYDPKRSEIYERLGIATVATVKWTAERIMRRIVSDRPSVEWTDPSAELVLVERIVGDAWVGERIGELDRGCAKVVGVRRFGKALLASDDVLVQQGDVLYVAVLNDDIAKLDAFLTQGPGERR